VLKKPTIASRQRCFHLCLISELLMNIPKMEPCLFRDTYECTLAVLDGGATVDKSELARIGDQLTELYGQDPGEFEKTLVTVAMSRFEDDEALRCYLARADALGLLFDDDQLTEAWAVNGWVHLSSANPGAFAPARFLIEAAAVCPLKETPIGEPACFDLDAFHAAAYQRAAARGVGFEPQQLVRAASGQR
jgi:hypothetical protein